MLFSRLIPYVLRFKKYLAISVIAGLVYVASIVGGLGRFSGLFNGIVRNTLNLDMRTVFVLVIIGALYGLSHYLIFMSSNSLAVSVTHDIRLDVYEKLVDLPIAYYKTNRTGDILSRLLNDIGMIEIFFMNIFIEYLVQPILFISIVSVLLMTSLRLTLYLFAIAPVMALVLWGLGSLVQKLSGTLQKKISSVTSNFQETVYGIEIIKGYGVEKLLKNKFRQSNDAYLSAYIKEIKARVLGTPVSEFMGVIAVLIFLILGAISVKMKVSSPDQILSFLFYATALSMPLAKINELILVPRKLQASTGRIFEIIDSRDKEDYARPEIGEITGKVVFENVSFSYGVGLSTLSDIELTINAGETVAVVGPSGAGKSTLISLIVMFYKASSGRVLFDGRDIAEYNPLSFRSKISLVTQDNILFSGTIMENIRLSKQDASDEEVLRAAAVANADGFIDKLPEGYMTMLGDRGVRLSGGEKQRIALARAVLREPKILILDEATSSLDAESENMIQKAMSVILGRQTTIIITHKLPTIAAADKIVVMDNGKIIETGTHSELIENRGIYHRLFSFQVNL